MPGGGWPSFRRMVPIPFTAWLAALDSWQLTGPGGELRLGQGVLRGPAEHDRHFGTCRVETLVITRKAGKVVTIPLAPRTARAIDLATGERVEGPIFLTSDGQRLDRHGAARVVRRVARRAGISVRVRVGHRRRARICGQLSSPVRNHPAGPGANL